MSNIQNQVYNKYLELGKISDRLTFINESQKFLRLYEQLCREHELFQKKERLPFLDNRVQIAQSIYYTDLSDYKDKEKDKNYYRKNCSAFNIVTQTILEKLQNESTPEATSSKLQCLIRKYIEDSLLIINDYYLHIIIKNGDNEQQLPFSITRVRRPDYSFYYDICKQIIFGEGHYDDSSDPNNLSPALIRVMIEVRLKWSMGISGYEYIVPKVPKKKIPGNMNNFLEVYKSFVKTNKIIVYPDFYIIERIYRWGNNFIHGGLHPYAWLTGFAINLLQPLFDGNGENHAPTWSGVKVQSQATIYEFWDKLKQSSRDREIRIDPYKPGFICTDMENNKIPCQNHYFIYENYKNSFDNLSYNEKLIAIYNMKLILQEKIDTIGHSLYKRVKSTYVGLREKEIRERAYYLWLERKAPLWDAEEDWYDAIEQDIEFLPSPI